MDYGLIKSNPTQEGKQKRENGNDTYLFDNKETCLRRTKKQVIKIPL
jgi:hypothetical protein